MVLLASLRTVDPLESSVFPRTVTRSVFGSLFAKFSARPLCHVRQSAIVRLADPFT